MTDFEAVFTDGFFSTVVVVRHCLTCALVELKIFQDEMGFAYAHNLAAA